MQGNEYAMKNQSWIIIIVFFIKETIIGFNIKIVTALEDCIINLTSKKRQYSLRF